MDITVSVSLHSKWLQNTLYKKYYLYTGIESVKKEPSYWGKHALGPIRACMTRINYLCLRDENKRIKKGEAGYDPLYRTRTLIDQLNDRFDSIPQQARLCVDEQMCGTKMKHHLRQYMLNKPHKWGIKLSLNKYCTEILPSYISTTFIRQCHCWCTYVQKVYIALVQYVLIIYPILSCLVITLSRTNLEDFRRSLLALHMESLLVKYCGKTKEPFDCYICTYVGVQPFEKAIKSGVAKTPRYDRKSKKYV